MTLYQFRLLAPEVQLRHVLSEGQYLAQRWEAEFVGLNLYFLDDGGPAGAHPAELVRLPDLAP